MDKTLGQIALESIVGKVSWSPFPWRMLNDQQKSDWEAIAAAVAAAVKEEDARICETAEVAIDIDVWMGTKKALTAATAIGLAAAIRASIKTEVE